MRCKACNEVLQLKDDLDPIQELCNSCYDWRIIEIQRDIDEDNIKFLLYRVDGNVK